jgi:hypothetical protein
MIRNIFFLLKRFSPWAVNTIEKMSFFVYKVVDFTERILVNKRGLDKVDKERYNPIVLSW